MKKITFCFQNDKEEHKTKTIVEINRQTAFNIGYEMNKELQEQTKDYTWTFGFKAVDPTDETEVDYGDCIKCERAFCICGGEYSNFQFA